MNTAKCFKACLGASLDRCKYTKGLFIRLSRDQRKRRTNEKTVTSPLPLSHDSEDYTTKSPERRKRKRKRHRTARSYAGPEGSRECCSV
ncbi:hypothetical protein AVEN_239764-1 [Araneus ventricosus]|uniref:Uncharacterized protein n=1 Tax=Araneus ventricosus TaxID=182803 RepID=A0A4Y2ET40_ARAVE|nr:hypothetical protein AVEN_239764-1 [Araneus ventricosus]